MPTGSENTREARPPWSNDPVTDTGRSELDMLFLGPDEWPTMSDEDRALHKRVQQETLWDQVRSSDGMITLTMGELAERCAFARLGKHIPAAIGDWLSEMRVGYLPTQLPQDRSSIVQLFTPMRLSQMVDQIRRSAFPAQ